MKKVIIQEHGNEWSDRVMICPECSGDKLFSTPIHWRTTTREGEGVRYQCKTCDCRFEVREKDHVKDSVKFRIALTFSFIFGFIALCAWLVKIPYFSEDIGTPPTLFTYSTTVAFFINLFFTLYWGDAA